MTTHALNFGPLSPYTGIPRQGISATLRYLKACQHWRTIGRAVSYTHDPAWLIDQAINRRACWPDDPSASRGSCMPVNGRYPRRAQGDLYMRTWRLSRALGRVRVLEREVVQVLGIRRAGKLVARVA